MTLIAVFDYFEYKNVNNLRQELRFIFICDL